MPPDAPARRVGLLGGTFDPPHLGHLVLAEVARVRLQLQEVRFVVAGAPWMKGDETAAEHRLAMVELAVAANETFVVDRREVDRAGATYTAETLRELHAEAPGTSWYFLVGADAAAQLDEWHQPDEVRRLATLVVVPRPGYDAPHVAGAQRLDVPLVGISSTELRRRFANGDAVRYQVPADVETYVRRHALYGT